MPFQKASFNTRTYVSTRFNALVERVKLAGLAMQIKLVERVKLAGLTMQIKLVERAKLVRLAMGY